MSGRPDFINVLTREKGNVCSRKMCSIKLDDAGVPTADGYEEQELFVSFDMSTKRPEAYSIDFLNSQKDKVTVYLAGFVDMAGDRYTPTTFINFATLIDKYILS